LAQHVKGKVSTTAPSKEDLPLLLVVDDDPFFVRLVSVAADPMYRVIGALTPAEIERSTLKALHTLVLDLNIPDVNVIEFIQSFQNIAHKLNLVIISGLAEKTVQLSAEVARFLPFHSVDVLFKPLNMKVLNELFRRISCRTSLESNDRVVMSEESLISISEVKAGLENNEFVTYFQPQLRMPGGEFSGVEALVRWQHPEKGLLYPASFIELIELPELSMPFTLYVANEAVKQFLMIDPAIRKDGKLSINVPHAALDHPQLTDGICEILKMHGFEPGDLVVEITERGLQGNQNDHASAVAMMRIKGIEISIDDFGTGNSGFQRLKKIAVDEIKLDKMFVQDVCESRTSQLLVKAAIDIARELNVRLVVEGIETTEALSWLCAAGDFIGQGYLFSRPLPREELEKYLTELHQKSIKA
jgi:EAL domain-containing protein (putative c-di-GMP-specific phosphodiesterase class I)